MDQGPGFDYQFTGSRDDRGTSKVHSEEAVSKI